MAVGAYRGYLILGPGADRYPGGGRGGESGVIIGGWYRVADSRERSKHCALLAHTLKMRTSCQTAGFSKLTV